MTGPSLCLQAEFLGLYSSDNVFISGTHTHASPAGFLQHLIYDLSSFGFVSQPESGAQGVPCGCVAHTR